jgi:hypothetical protein
MIVGSGSDFDKSGGNRLFQSKMKKELNKRYIAKGESYYLNTPSF